MFNRVFSKISPGTLANDAVTSGTLNRSTETVALISQYLVYPWTTGIPQLIFPSKECNTDLSQFCPKQDEQTDLVFLGFEKGPFLHDIITYNSSDLQIFCAAVLQTLGL